MPDLTTVHQDDVRSFANLHQDHGQRRARRAPQAACRPARAGLSGLGGHLLLEDLPGAGKTMLARALTRSVDYSFARIQFAPDLPPSNVTGVTV